MWSIVKAQKECHRNTNSNCSQLDSCFQPNAINITAPDESTSESLTNRIPEDLIDDFVYEVMDNTSKMLTDNTTKSCVCQLRQCIQLCSYSIHDLYNYMLENNRSSEEMEIFYISLILSNGTIVQRHLINDFQTIVYRRFCDSNYSLSPELDSKNSWAFFEVKKLISR